MHLVRITIKNYRSIKELTLDFEPKCRILVGINESGKTNILMALNLLDPKQVSTRRDLREPGLREEQITKAHVWFAFGLDKEEGAKLTSDVKTKVLSKTYSSAIIKIGEAHYTLERFCKSLEGVYVADVLAGKKYAATWGLIDSSILNKWKKVADECPPTFQLHTSDEQQVNLKSFKLVDTSQFSDIPDEYVEDATGEDLREIASSFITPLVTKSLPKVLFWDYDESKLLPPRIDLDQFCTNPDICVPLKRMFQLHGISDIKKEVAAAKTANTNALSNLLRRVAESASKHFHSTWREYDGIKFSLLTDGPDLVASIEDESNRYELSQRSDGFKRFVTFLLMVSAEDASDLLKDTLILIDEPEIGLHPTGSRYLMDELIDISKNNYVVFSTHSIFMIDNKIIRRHLIVRKKNEITEAEVVSESNIQDEEVIYKSLGYSIFSNLKEKNLIFEGWRDKKLFETALSRVPAEYEAVKTLKNLGHCFSRGVKEIKSITPLFEAGSRKCLILSDSDAMAKEHQKKYQQERGFGTWKRYDEVIADSQAVTGEDFVKEAAFRGAIQEISHRHGIPELPLNDLSGAGGKMRIFKQWLTAAGIGQGNVDQALEDIKESVLDSLKNSEIKSDYFEYLVRVVNLVEHL